MLILRQNQHNDLMESFNYFSNIISTVSNLVSFLYEKYAQSDFESEQENYNAYKDFYYNFSNNFVNYKNTAMSNVSNYIQELNERIAERCS